jgi:hypothetical protein
MKTPFVVILAVFCGHVSQASVIFKNPSNIPVSVQQHIANQIQEKCPEARDHDWSIMEKATDVRYEREANYFTTDFSVYARSKSQPQIKSGLLKVETMQVLPSEATAGGIVVQSIKGLCL